MLEPIEYDRSLNLLVNLYNIEGIHPTFAVRLYASTIKPEWILMTRDETKYFTSYEAAKEELLKHVNWLVDIWSY